MRVTKEDLEGKALEMSLTGGVWYLEKPEPHYPMKWIKEAIEEALQTMYDSTKDLQERLLISATISEVQMAIADKILEKINE